MAPPDAGPSMAAARFCLRSGAMMFAGHPGKKDVSPLHVSDARAVARRALAHRGDPGSLCGPESRRAGRRERRIAASAPARRRRAVVRGGDLVDAFCRHAGDALTVPSRLSGFSHPAVVPGLCSRGRRRDFHGQRRPADRLAACHRRDRHGRRHRIDALHRNDRAARERTHAARGPFVVASVVIAIAASGLALWLAGGRGGRPRCSSRRALSAPQSPACTILRWRA